MHSDQLPPPVWVANQMELHSLEQNLASQPRVAVDTESNSLYAYQEQVCLIQFSTRQIDYLVDPLALPDLDGLVDFFSDGRIEKVFHAAEYDLICLQRDFNICVTNLFDTMQASRILGRKQVGLDHLLAEKCNVQVNKKFQKADWGKRPLADALLNYARVDTHYLLPLRDELAIELKERGRWELACEEFNRLSRLRNQAEERQNCPSWKRVHGSHRVSGQELAILQELCLWRERQAKRVNRPVFKVLGDKHILAIAQSAPEDMAALERQGLSTRQRNQYGESLLKSVRRGLQARPVLHTAQKKPNEAFLKRMDILRKWRQQTAKCMGVESDIVLPRSILMEIAKQNPQNMEALTSCMPDSPWRREHFGHEILSHLKKEK